MKNKKTILNKIIWYCDRINDFAAEVSIEAFSQSYEKQLAVCMALVQIGEMTARLPDQHKERHPDVPWKKIKGLRNIMVHEYDTLNLQLIWDVVEKEIPILSENIKRQQSALQDETTG